jgi:hypothetical protein
VDQGTGNVQGVVAAGEFSRRFRPVDVFADVPALPAYLGTGFPSASVPGWQSRRLPTDHAAWPRSWRTRSARPCPRQMRTVSASTVCTFIKLADARQIEPGRKAAETGESLLLSTYVVAFFGVAAVPAAFMT